MNQQILSVPFPERPMYRPVSFSAKLKKAKRILKHQVIKISQVYYDIVGSKVECNICHYKANKLHSNDWHLYSSCPACGTTVRTRLLYAALAELDNFSEDRLIRGKSVLHFAPENAIRSYFQQIAGNYKTADYLAIGYDYEAIDYNLDITNMRQLRDASFDCVIACDVLEHVYNLKNGIREVYRVLTRGGYAIFTVPQKDHLEKTIEDITITDRAERKRLFGQEDHLRIFGNDFPYMLEQEGFEVTAVDESFFDRSEVERHVLAPPVLSDHPLATNFRKAFFGKKL